MASFQSCFAASQFELISIEANTLQRRRTQIRMAQRAYRHRKESTITTLEQRVEKLLRANEEMNASFVSLHDFAVSKGILQREPEFGRELQTTIEKFLDLAKSTSEENSKNDSKNDGDSEGTNHSGQDADTSHRKRGRRPAKRSNEEAAGKLPSVETTTSDNIWGGYMVTEVDDKTEDQMPLDFPHEENGFGMRHREPGLEVISRPTEENASFPFDFDFMDLQQYRVEVPADAFTKDVLASDLPLPTSGAFSEHSFARRLHRTALERGYLLLTSDKVNPSVMQKVFGFCLLYESPAEITARLKRLISGTREDSLHNWRAPFYHIGGNGTHYPQPEHTLGDDKTLKYGEHGRSMGPFSAATSQFEDIYMNKTRCTLPGYEGVFYDSYDIEGILHALGIDIPPAADYVTCELDVQFLMDHYPGAGGPILESVLSGEATSKSINAGKEDEIDAGLLPTLLSFPVATGINDWTTDSSEKTPTTMSESSIGSSQSPKRLVTINVHTLLESKSSELII